MKSSNNNIFRDLNFYSESNTNEIINRFEKSLGIIFQEEYKKIMIKSNGSAGYIGKEYIEFWSLEDIEDFISDIDNSSLNGLIPFASDGCGMAYALKNDSDEIRMIPIDSLDYKYSVKCGNDFDDFILKLYNGTIEEY